MNENTTRIAALAVGLIALSMALVFMGPSVSDDVKTLIAAIGFAMLAIAVVFSFRRKGEVTKDERTEKITSKSLAWSWWLTYLFITALFWLTRYGAVKINVEETMSYVFFYMVFSALFAKIFFAGRGDA